jgi:guanylate kinase
MTRTKGNRQLPNDRFSQICQPPKPLLILLSGLSGAGKDTVLDGLRKSGLPFYFSVSATTRPPRSGEKEGVDYHFVSKKQFQTMIDSNQLIEWANVYGNFYGRPKEPIRQALEKGKDVLVRLDVQGAAAYKQILPGAVAIFMTATSIADLEKRLKKRSTESPEELELRLQTAEKELDQLGIFDYIIINRENELERTITDVQAIISAEKCRVSQREVRL